MSTNPKHRHTTSERQGRSVARWNREQQAVPDWHANPKTASERQAASLVAEPDTEDDR